MLRLPTLLRPLRHPRRPRGPAFGRRQQDRQRRGWSSPSSLRQQQWAVPPAGWSSTATACGRSRWSTPRVSGVRCGRVAGNAPGSVSSCRVRGVCSPSTTTSRLTPGLLTTRACRWAIDQLAGEHASLLGIARQRGVAWKTVWGHPGPILATFAAPWNESRIATCNCFLKGPRWSSHLL